MHFVDSNGKRHLLAQLLREPSVTSAIVFTRTKRGADRVALQLNAEKISATAMHGNLGQNARQRALDQFKAGQVRVLVATDLAARGIDVVGISARLQLRTTERARKLCSPHRSDRPQRRQRHRGGASATQPSLVTSIRSRN